MRRTALAAIWAGLTASALSGCGTAHNFMGDNAGPGRCEVFGGVRSDVSTGFQCLKEAPPRRDDLPVQDLSKMIGWYLLTVDLPLSAVGDTATLPLTVLSQLVGAGGPAVPAGRKDQDRAAEAPEQVDAALGAPEEETSP